MISTCEWGHLWLMEVSGYSLPCILFCRSLSNGKWKCIVWSWPYFRWQLFLFLFLFSLRFSFFFFLFVIHFRLPIEIVVYFYCFQPFFSCKCCFSFILCSILSRKCFINLFLMFVLSCFVLFCFLPSPHHLSDYFARYQFMEAVEDCEFPRWCHF